MFTLLCNRLPVLVALLSVFTFQPFFSQNSYAQPVLLPSIGLGSLPADSDPICTIPVYLDPDGTYQQPGIQAGDTCPDFTFYDLAGNPWNLANELSDGQPVLLIGGSYTCPVFRNKTQLYNDLVTAYAGQVKVVIMYTVEAHPDIDISPYFGIVNTGNANQTQGILYRQPTTYGERKAIVDSMQNDLGITAPVLIDGPCNEWWEEYALAPNLGVLIDTNGIVFSRQGWIHNSPLDIYCDIDSLLGIGGGCSITTTGSFEWVLDGDSAITGVPGATHHAYGYLVNNSADHVTIEVRRLQENIPVDWGTSICTDFTCYPQAVDSAEVTIAPGDTSSYIMYFYTGPNSDYGNVRMGFRNINDFSNSYLQMFECTTDSSLVSVGEAIEQLAQLQLYPNPAGEMVQVETTGLFASGSKLEVTLFDMNGRMERQEQFIQTPTITIHREGLPSGLYFVRIVDEAGNRATGRLLFR